MAVDAPNFKDVTEYQFKLHDKIKLFNPSKQHRSNVNLLATASAYGLIFVGDPNKAEFKVIQLKNFVELKETEGNILARIVPLPNVANNIAVSSDNTLLAINYTLNSSGFITIYSVPTFLSTNIQAKYTIRISPEENVEARQILWNPVLCSIFAVILNNGAMGLYNLKDVGYEFHSIDKQEQVKCACWSPKGKQIVVGFPGGKLVQYKPDLKPARIISCPGNIHEGPFSTISIQWLSTYQFAVVFLQNGENVLPSLYIVNAPKVGNPTYINYSDICYSQYGPRNAQIFLNYIQPWNILLMVTANSMELGMLGTTETGETPTWRQYIPPDEARVELPLTADKEDTYPIGFAFETGTTHQLVIDENQIPTMPMIHLLSTHGMLISFDFLNLTQNAPSLCSPPQPISDTSGISLFTPYIDVPNSSSGVTNQQQIQTKSFESNIGSGFGQPTTEISFALPSGATSTPATVNKTKAIFDGTAETGNTFGTFGTTQTSTTGSIFGTLNSSGTTITAIPSNTTSNIKSGSMTPNIFSSQSAGQTLNFGGQAFGTKLSLGSNQSTVSSFGGKPAQTLSFGQNLGGGGILNSDGGKTVSFEAPKENTPNIGGSNLMQKIPDQMNKIPEAEKNKPLYTIPATYTATSQQQQLKIEEKKSLSTALKDIDVNDVIKEIILTQIESFELELKELSHRSKDINITIGTMEESESCDKKLNELQELSDRAIESTDSLTSDIQALRNSLNESFAMVAEAKSKLNMFKNPELLQLATISNLNQTNRRQLTKLNSMVATNEAHLHIVTQQIDAQWSNFQDLVRQNARTKIHIPSLEGIYQTMRKLKDIIARERIKLNYFKSKLGARGILELEKLKSNVTMDSLTDSILSMSLSEQVKSDNERLTAEKLQAIRDVLRNRKIVKIKPQRPERIGLNSEVIQEIRIKTAAKQRDGAANKPEKMEKQRIKDEQRTIAKPTATKPMAMNFPKQVEAKQMLQFQQKQQQQQQAFQMTQRSLVTPKMNQFFAPPPPPSPTGPVTTGTSIVNKEISSFTPTSNFNFNKSFAKTNQSPVTITSIGFGTKPTNTAPLTFGTTKVENPKSLFDEPKPNQMENITLQKIETVPKDMPPAPLSFTPKVLETEPKPILSFGLNTFNPPSFGFAKSNNNASEKETKSDVSAKPETEQSSENIKPAIEVTRTEPTNLSTPFASFNLPPSTDIQAKPSIFGGFSLPVSIAMSSSTTSTAPSLFAPLTLTTNKVESSTIPQPVAVTSSLSNQTSNAASTSTFSFSLTPKTETDSVTKSTAGLTFGGFAQSANATNVPASSAGFAFGLQPAVGSMSSTSTISSPSSTFSFGDYAKISEVPTTPSVSDPLNTTTGIATTADNLSLPKTTDGTDSLFGSLNICKPNASATSTAQSTSANVFGGSIFSSSAFSPSSTSAETKSIFGSSTATTAAAPLFGTPVGTATSVSVFGGTSPATTSSGNIFGGMPKPDQSVFGAQSIPTTSASPFGVQVATSSIPATVTSPFGVQVATSTPATSVSPFGVQVATSTPATSVSPFGAQVVTSTPATSVSPFGVQVATSTPATSASPFGIQTTKTSPFGIAPSNQSAAGGNIFGAAANLGFGMQPSTTGAVSGGSIFGVTATVSSPSNVFGGNTGTNIASPVFGIPKTEATTSIFGSPQPVQGESLFGTSSFGQTGQSTGSIFGGSGVTSTSPNAFGSSVFSQTSTSSAFGGGQQTQQTSPFGGGGGGGVTTGGFGQSIFGSGGSNTSAFGQTTAFGSTSPGGSFVQGGPSIAQTGFGSPGGDASTTGGGGAFDKPLFGTTPAFGASPAFGSPPAFGRAPTFGGGPSFGSPKNAFGSFATGNSPNSFSQQQQQQNQNNIFDSIGSSNAEVTFHNLAQNTNNAGAKPQFGGSSFSSWR